MFYIVDEANEFDRIYHGITRDNPFQDTTIFWLMHPEKEDCEPDFYDEDDDGY